MMVGREVMSVRQSSLDLCLDHGALEPVRVRVLHPEGLEALSWVLFPGVNMHTGIGSPRRGRVPAVRPAHIYGYVLGLCGIVIAPVMKRAGRPVSVCIPHILVNSGGGRSKHTLQPA